jgi:hypothetical protein
LHRHPARRLLLRPRPPARQQLRHDASNNHEALDEIAAVLFKTGTITGKEFGVNCAAKRSKRVDGFSMLMWHHEEIPTTRSKIMTKAAIYTRSSTSDHDRQREELLAKFGGTHEIIGEYRDHSPGSSALKYLLEDSAKDDVDILLCTDLTRLTRHLSPEIMTAIWEAGVRVVTVDGAEMGVPELIAHTFVMQSQVIYDPLLVFTFFARSQPFDVPVNR